MQINKTNFLQKNYNQNVNNFNNESLSFKKISLVKVPKEIFVEPNNPLECLHSVESFVKSFTHEKTGKFYNILEKIGLSKYFKKAIGILETPTYPVIQDKLNKDAIGSLNWFLAHSGMKIEDLIPKSKDSIDPADRDFYRVYIFTGKDKDEILKQQNCKNSIKLIKDIWKDWKSKIANSENIDVFYNLAQLSKTFNKPFVEYLKDKNINTIEINSKGKWIFKDIFHFIDKELDEI